MGTVPPLASVFADRQPVTTADNAARHPARRGENGSVHDRPRVAFGKKVYRSIDELRPHDLWIRK